MKSFDEHMAKYEDLILDEEDREMLAAMGETQREKLLYSRYQKIREIEEKKQLRNMDTVQHPQQPQRVSTPEKQIRHTDCDFIVLRSAIVGNIFKPFFSLFKGCFTRAKLNKVYKIVKITGITETEPYQLEMGKDIKTNLALSIDDGGRIMKNFAVSNISSRGVEEDECEEFLEKFQIKEIDGLRKRYQRVMKEMTRDLTDEELTKTIENKLKANPKKKTNTARKIELILKRDEAMSAKNKKDALLFQQELEKLEDEERAKKMKEEEEEIRASKRRMHS